MAVETDSTSQHWLSLPFFRLRWPIFEPLSEITVMDDATDENSPQHPYQTTLQDGTICLHPIAYEPVTEEPTPFVSVQVDALQAYRDSWWDFHYDHNPEDETDNCPCCGLPVYQPPEPLLVRPTDPARTYVTVGDYIAQVQAWVSTHHDDIRNALRFGRDELDRQGRLWVWGISADRLDLEEEEDPSQWPRAWGIRAAKIRRLLEAQATQPVQNLPQVTAAATE